MTRRQIATMLSMPAIALGRPVGAPTDVTRLVAFALKYNRYMAKLSEGQVDLKLWAEVDERFHELY